jgi:hypothetical protein
MIGIILAAAMFCCFTAVDSANMPAARSRGAGSVNARRSAITADRVAATRKWLPSVLIRIGGTGPGAPGAPINPALLALQDDRFLTADLHDRTIKAYTIAGVPLFSTNPDSISFFSITSLIPIGHGSVWITDPAAQIVIGIDSSGRPTQRTRFADALTAAVPTADHVLAWNWGTFAAWYRKDGSRIRQLELPSPLRTIPSGARETEIARARNGVVVAGFRFSSDLVLYNPNGEMTQLVRGIEPVVFPSMLSVKQAKFQVLRVAPRASEGAVAVAIDGLRAYVLFAGASSYAHRVVDVYLVADGHYQGSFLLPQVASAIAADAKHFGVLYAQPFPHIVVYRNPLRS